MKRKRTTGDMSKFGSTSEFTEESSMMDSVDSSYESSKRIGRMEKQKSEDAQELLSPRDGEPSEGGSFVFDPIIVSDDDTTDDENPVTDKLGKEKERRDAMQLDPIITREMPLVDAEGDATMGEVSDDDDHQERTQPHHVHTSIPHVSLIRTHTPPNALLPSHGRIRPEGQQQQVMHIFHDELATLYEEENKSSDSSDSATKSSSSITENRIVPVQDSLDESNIRARWEYALRLMVGNCEPSELFSFADLMPSSITNGHEDMEIAEI